MTSVVVAVVCIGAAAWVLSSDSNRADFSRAVQSARHAPVWLLAAVLALPLANWILTTISFWLLTRPFGRVGLAEMWALMGVSWLANYLPLKPGLVGRLAYHARFNKIPVRDGARALVHAVLLSAASAGLLVAFALAAGHPSAAWSMPTIVCTALAALGTIAWAAVHSIRLRRADSDATTPPPGVRSSLFAAFGVRILDSSVWVVRYLLVFEVVGSPIPLVQAAAVAAVSQAVASLPIVGSAPGIREWSVGVLSTVLPPGAQKVIGSGASAALSVGLMADILNRIAEVVLAIPIGLSSAAWLARHVNRGE